MSVYVQEDLDSAEPLDPVWLHRIDRFRELGFNPLQRKALADRGVDWHIAAALVLPPPDGKGCPIDIAFDILS